MFSDAELGYFEGNFLQLDIFNIEQSVLMQRRPAATNLVSHTDCFNVLVSHSTCSRGRRFHSWQSTALAHIEGLMVAEGAGRAVTRFPIPVFVPL